MEIAEAYKILAKHLDGTNEDEAVAHRLALMCMDYRMPEPVTYDADNGSKCSTCGLWIIQNRVNNFCPRCGQKLKWRKTYEED